MESVFFMASIFFSKSKQPWLLRRHLLTSLRHGLIYKILRSFKIFLISKIWLHNPFNILFTPQAYFAKTLIKKRGKKSRLRQQYEPSADRTGSHTWRPLRLLSTSSFFSPSVSVQIWVLRVRSISFRKPKSSLGNPANGRLRTMDKFGYQFKTGANFISWREKSSLNCSQLLP